MQDPILVVTQGEQGFSGVRCQLLRIVQNTFCCIAPSGSSIEAAEKVKVSVHARKPRPSKREIGVKLHRPLIKAGDFDQEIGI